MRLSRARLAAVPLALLGARVPAQVAASHLQRLAAPEPAQREDARRRLASMPRADLPVDALLRCVAEGKESAEGALQVLALHADLAAAARRLLDVPRAPVELVEAALPILSVDDLWQVAMAARTTPSRRSERALAELARRGALLAGPVVDVLGATDAMGPAAFAAELIAHGDLPPPAIAAAIGANASARQRVLRALADHPRDDFVPWLLPWLEGDDPATTLLALAALPPSRQTSAHARLVLRLLSAEVAPSLLDLAASRFSARIADGLVAAAHGAMLQGAKLADLLPLLGSVSRSGEGHLLGLAMTLADDDREELIRWLDTRDSELLAQRIGAALDGGEPIDVCFLRRAGPYLKTPARVAKVVAELKAVAPRPAAAFTALIDAARFDPEMLRVAGADPSTATARMRDLLRLPRGVLPLEFARGFLHDADATFRLSAVHYLAAPGMDQITEAALAEVLQQDADDRVRAACARALSVLGSDTNAAAAFEFAFGSGYAGEAVDWLLERPRPFGLVLLQQVRARRVAPRELDELDTGRVRLGDPAPLPSLLDRLADLPLRLIKRLLPSLRTLADASSVNKLQRAAANTELGDSVRECLVDALAAQPSAPVEFLRHLYEHEDDDGIRLAALRGLLLTPAGAELLRELHAAIGQRPLKVSDEDMAFEVLGAAPLPLPFAVVEFAARCVLLAPLANPVGEADLGLSERGEGADYPLVQPLGELIRRDPKPEHGEAIVRVLAQSRAHRNAHALARRRLGHLLGYLTLSEPAFAAAAPALARAIVDAPDRDKRWLGPAWGVLARDLEAKGELDAAATAYQRARDGFLYDPLPALQRRRFLRDPDPARGSVPMGELAARPHLLRARLALARDDRDAARRALVLARSRASADAQTLADLDALTKQVEGK